MRLVDYGSCDFRVLLDSTDLMALMIKGTGFVLDFGDGMTFESRGEQTRVEFPQRMVVTVEMAVMEDVELVIDTARKVKEQTDNEAVRRVMDGVLKHLGAGGETA